MFVKRLAITSVAQVVQLVLNTVALVLLARLLAPDELGVFLLLTATLALLGVALTAGPQASVLVAGAKSEVALANLHGQAIAMSVLGAVLGAVAGLLLAEAVAGLLSNAIAASMVVMTLWRLAPTVYGGLVTALLTGAGRISQLAAVNVAAAATTLAAPAGALAAPRDPLFGAVAGALVGSGAFLVIAMAIGWRAFGFMAPHDLAAWREMGRLALPVHLGTAAYWVMLRADIYIVNAMLTGTAVGIYGFALSLAERVSVIAGPIYGAAANQVSGSDRATAGTITAILVRVHLWIALGLFVGALIVGAGLLELLGGPAYSEAAGPFALLLLGSGILPIWGMVGLFLISQVHAAWTTTVLQVSAAVAAVSLYWALVPVFGITGAAIGSAVAYTALPLAGVLVVVRRAGIAPAEFVPRPGDVRLIGRVVRRYAGGS